MRQKRTCVRQSNPVLSSEDEDADEEGAHLDVYSSDDEDADDSDFDIIPRPARTAAARKSAQRKYTGTTSTRSKATRAPKSKQPAADCYHEFSITFSKLGTYLPEDEFHKGADYLEGVLDYMTCVYEQGDEEGHWHAQCTGGGTNIKKDAIHAALKSALGWEGANRQSNWNLVVKYLTHKNKVHTRFGMIGYCHKNVQRLEDAIIRNKNVGEADIKAGLDAYLLYGSSQLKGRTELTKYNLFAKADLSRRFRMTEEEVREL
ncbi:hypothetical protein CYMTET_17201 [Cymbomonas tetramitiformis]|uniref:Uncharacterized protein n=1 Tax=Cymbomonas tetramitiformis TaxID=36881 RepID=A0AAE0L7H5_9CHLO|nr:hypothetical protein CYMTET_17201 [Cymbomonas tetramitiformis]